MFTVRWSRLVLTLGCAIPGVAGVVFQTAPGSAHWYRLKLATSWIMHPTSAAEWEKHAARLAFRVQRDSLLVAGEQSYGEHPSVFSSNQAVVGLRTGTVREARTGEWDNAKPIAAYEGDPFREPPLIEGAIVSYGHRLFRGAGKTLETCVLSPDGSWLALMSYTASEAQGQSLTDFQRGVVYADIFQVSTGAKAAALSGSYSLGFELEDLLDNLLESLRNAQWISDRHFFLPTPKNREVMLCDMKPNAPIEETAWDYIPKTSEILGFWEEPQVGGYFNGLVSLVLHAAARISEAGEYSLKADVTGPQSRPASGYQARLTQGTRSIRADLTYPETDGGWRIQTMSLKTGPGSRTLAATAANLGSTEEYISYTKHPNPEVLPLPPPARVTPPPPVPKNSRLENIQVAGVDPNASGKFAALAVSIALPNWPLPDCHWNADLLDREGGRIDHVALFVAEKSPQLSLIFDGSKIAADAAGSPWRLGGISVHCNYAGPPISFQDAPLPQVAGLSRDSFTTVPAPGQVKFTGANEFELIDDDHNGHPEFVHVRLGVNTSRRKCVLAAVISDAAGVSRGTINLLQEPDGSAFSAYVSGAQLSENNKPGTISFHPARLACGKQTILLPPHTIATEVDVRKFERPFVVSLSPPFNAGAHHVEYWINCKAKAPLRFPLTAASESNLGGEDVRVNIDPTSSACTDHAFKINVDTTDKLPPGNYEQVLFVHPPGGEFHFENEVRFEWRVNEVPHIFGVTPAQGIGPEAGFHVAALDRNYDIARVDLLINDKLDERGGCYVSYLDKAPGSNKDPRGMVLRSDDGTKDVVSWLAGQTALENDRCAIGKKWDQLLREMTIRFNPPFYGAKNIYARATDTSGASSGWQQTGMWTASDEQPPEPVAMSPYLGSGIKHAFDFTFSDINGSEDIESAEILVQFGREKAKACALLVDRKAGLLRLLDDNGSDAAGTIEFKAAGRVQNQQCGISGASLKTESRDVVHVGMTVEFDRSFKGRRNIYARAKDKAGLASPWRWLGSWMVE